MFPELSRLQYLGDELIKLCSANSLSIETARRFGLELASAERTYSTTTDDRITINVDASPFDVALWDVAIQKARNGDWSTLSANFRDMSHPFLTDALGNAEDLAWGMALYRLSQLLVEV